VEFVWAEGQMSCMADCTILSLYYITVNLA